MTWKHGLTAKVRPELLSPELMGKVHLEAPP